MCFFLKNDFSHTSSRYNRVAGRPITSGGRENACRGLGVVALSSRLPAPSLDVVRDTGAREQTAPKLRGAIRRENRRFSRSVSSDPVIYARPRSAARNTGPLVEILSGRRPTRRLRRRIVRVERRGPDPSYSFPRKLRRTRAHGNNAKRTETIVYRLVSAFYRRFFFFTRSPRYGRSAGAERAVSDPSSARASNESVIRIHVKTVVTRGRSRNRITDRSRGRRPVRKTIFSQTSRAHNNRARTRGVGGRRGNLYDSACRHVGIGAADLSSAGYWSPRRRVDGGNFSNSPRRVRRVLLAFTASLIKTDLTALAYLLN